MLIFGKSFVVKKHGFKTFNPACEYIRLILISLSILIFRVIPEGLCNVVTPMAFGSWSASRLSVLDVLGRVIQMYIPRYSIT